MAKKAGKNMEGFKKVAETAFYNPQTNEFFTACERDYGSPVDEDALRAWRHARGEFLEGDEIRIVRGRKMVGEVKRVARVYTFVPERCRGWRNESLYAVEYLYFIDGTKCASKNCEHKYPRERPHRVERPE